MYRVQHPSGWSTGFFRLGAAPGDSNNQLFINLVTREVKAMPYDTDLEAWEPLYIFMGNEPEKATAQPREELAEVDPRHEYNLNDKQVGLLWAIHTNDTEAMETGPTLAALSRRGLTVGQGKLELTDLGKRVAQQLNGGGE